MKNVEHKSVRSLSSCTVGWRVHTASTVSHIQYVTHLIDSLLLSCCLGNQKEKFKEKNKKQKTHRQVEFKSFECAHQKARCTILDCTLLPFLDPRS